MVERVTFIPDGVKLVGPAARARGGPLSAGLPCSCCARLRQPAWRVLWEGTEVVFRAVADPRLGASPENAL